MSSQMKFSQNTNIRNKNGAPQAPLLNSRIRTNPEAEGPHSVIGWPVPTWPY